MNFSKELTALYDAITSKKLEIMKMATGMKMLENIHPSPIFVALELGPYTIIQKLVDKGADIRSERTFHY